jgi:hypothetical protein
MVVSTENQIVERSNRRKQENILAGLKLHEQQF